MGGGVEPASCIVCQADSDDKSESQGRLTATSLVDRGVALRRGETATSYWTSWHYWAAP